MTKTVWIARGLAFILGAASLAGQVSWSRLAAAVVGGTLAASAITLAGAMAGLSAGALLWRKSLRATILACAASVAALPVVILQINRIEGGSSLRWGLTTALLALGQVPFGAILPTLTAWRTNRGERVAAEGGDLCAWGSLGAVAGALGVGDVLACLLGLDHIGFILGGVLLLACPLAGPSPSQLRSTDTTLEKVSPSWLAVAFGMGFLGLAAELLWLRVLGFSWESSPSTFAFVTASHLAGLSLGSWGVGRIVRRRPPGRTGFAFGLGLSAVTLAATAVLAPEAALAASAGERIPLALVLVGLPAVCFGGTFVCLLDAAGARALGRLCAANGAGAAAGPLVMWAAVPLVPWPPQMLVFVAAGYAALIVVVVSRSQSRMTAGVLTAALGLAGVALIPGTPGAGTYADSPTLAFVRAGLDSTVAVTRDPRTGVEMLWIDRSLQGDTSELGKRIPRLLGLLPGELLGRPSRRTLAIGLGTGLTVSGLLESGSRSVEVAELSPGVIDADRTILAEANGRVLERAEVRVYPADGRTQLADASAPYDLIVADMIFPSAAGAGNLFSREFYQLARRRLTPDGLFVHWIPCSQLSAEDLKSVFSAFLEAFPDGSAWIGFMAPRRLILGLAGGTIGKTLPDRFALGPGELRAWAAGATPIRDADPRLEHRSRPRGDCAYGVSNLQTLVRRMAPSAWTVFAEAGLIELQADGEAPGSEERRRLQDQARRLYLQAGAAGIRESDLFVRHLEVERHLYLADVLVARGRVEEAIAQLEKAVAKSPRSAEARLKLAALTGQAREK